MTDRTDTPAEAFARKLLKPLGALALVVFALIGFASCGARDATPTPAPTVTVTAAAAPAATAADSDAVALLKLSWAKVAASDRKAIREAWQATEGNPTMQRAMARTFVASMTAFPVTEAEALQFLAWAAEQR